MAERDIADHIRWYTTDTDWDDWDAPDEPTEPIDPDAFRAENLTHIRRMAELPDTKLRYCFEADADSVHLGWVSSYHIDQSFQWVRQGSRLALGLAIGESRYWGQGRGKRILAAFIRYLLEQGQDDLYLQTWSGNIRMIRAAQRLGFVECNRVVGNRSIRGGVYDSLTFRLDVERFRQYLIAAQGESA